MQPGKAVGERGERTSRRLLVVLLRQRGNPVGFAYHEPAQLHDRFLQDRAQVIACQAGEVRFHVGGVGQRGNITILVFTAAVVLVWTWLTAVSVELYRTVGQT